MCLWFGCDWIQKSKSLQKMHKSTCVVACTSPSFPVSSTVSYRPEWNMSHLAQSLMAPEVLYLWIKHVITTLVQHHISICLQKILKLLKKRGVFRVQNWHQYLKSERSSHSDMGYTRLYRFFCSIHLDYAIYVSFDALHNWGLHGRCG